jgi:glutamate dehydrogenase
MYDVNEIEEQIVQATLAWKDRLRCGCIEEFPDEQGEQLMRDLGEGFAPGIRTISIRASRSSTSSRFSPCGQDPLGMHLYRLLEEKDDHLKLRLYRRGGAAAVGRSADPREPRSARRRRARLSGARPMTRATGFRSSA